MSFLAEVLIYLASAVVLVPLARALGLGAVLGYLIAGVLIGPWALGLVTDVDAILHFSELGVVLLLFVIGLELRPSRLYVLRRLIFGNGLLQMAGTTLVLWPPAWMWLGDAGDGLLVAVVLSLSSTAIGLQMLAEKRQLQAAHGRAAFGVLLFQDLAVIPLLALMPLLAAGQGGTEAGTETSLPIQAVRTLVVIGLIVAAGRMLLPQLFRLLVRTRVREVFLAATLLVALGTALLAEWAGLSMALGAFLAGMLLSDSEFRHEIEAGIDPFKGLLLGLFFIAVGMNIDFGQMLVQPGLVFGLVAVLVVLKAAVLYPLGRWSGLDRRAAASLAFALPQAGEFGFVLFTLALGLGLLGADVVGPLIAAISISMALTPLLYFVGERWVAPRLADSEPEARQLEALPEDHGEPRVIIAGLGRVGQIVARNLSMLDIHFTALDFDQEQVEFVRRFGHRVYFGNASNLDVLRAAGAEHARLFVLTISDIELSVATAALIRRHFPDLRIHARARNRQHALELRALGVEYVIREAWLSSLDLARASLAALGVRHAERYVEMFRQHDEDALEAQIGHKDDEAELLKIDRRSREELAELFEEDRRILHESENGD
ncbi:MAG: monovalent cation:proton antiporter-2 (CPA2) family protein [Wenzhouxiangellaceae bacterium]|nr:monovalent cation:proton antiporter-2 (CPA2) family protein [Wenzhouxiangellaceae bacterium]